MISLENPVAKSYDYGASYAAQEVSLQSPAETTLVLLVSDAAAARWPGLIETFSQLANRISAERMRAANRSLDLDDQSIAAAANLLLQTGQP